jgi:hypothetical protein
VHEGMAMTIRAVVLGVTFAGALLAACASAPAPARERPQRVPDSAPDKAAATRSAAGLHLEEDDQRWGIDAARARKQNGEPQRQPAPPASVAAPTGH